MEWNEVEKKDCHACFGDKISRHNPSCCGTAFVAGCAMTLSAGIGKYPMLLCTEHMAQMMDLMKAQGHAFRETDGPALSRNERRAQKKTRLQ